MDITLSAGEMIALRELLCLRPDIRDAVTKIITARSESQLQECAHLMTMVPRQVERASDCAARGDELRGFWARLEAAYNEAAGKSSEASSTEGTE